MIVAEEPDLGSLRWWSVGYHDPVATATDTARRSWPQEAVPFVGLAFSGAAGLIYEVVWSRAMAALFGSVVTATGTLLALFMGGMAFGAAFGGRWAGRTRRPLLAFGAVEIAVGVLALATPALLRVALPLVTRIDVLLPESVQFVVPAGLSVVALGPVVVLLGATFPLFLAHVGGGKGTLGTDASRVYGINTLGAVAGTLLAGFALVPLLGIERSLWLAAAVDLVVGVTCVVLGRAAIVEEPTSTAPATAAPLVGVARTATVIALLGGFSALVLEVAWFRALTLIFGSSVYAMSLMLAAFLVGLGGGAIVLARRVGSHEHPRGLLAHYHSLVAFAATMATVVLQVLPAVFIPVLSVSHGSFITVALGISTLTLVFLVVPTTLMGAALPLAIHVAGGTCAAGQRARLAGRVYAASSLGSSVGALLAGFVLVPHLGLRGAVATAVGGSLFAAGLAAVAAPRQMRRSAAQVGALTLAIWVVWATGLFPWNWRVLTAGYYAYAHLYSHHRPPANGPLRRRLELSQRFGFARPQQPIQASTPASQEEMLRSWEEGSFAQVAVVEKNGVRSLLINGKTDASNGSGDMRTQLLLGHLPMLLAPNRAADGALVIGLGSGVTAGAVGTWGFETITVAEIEPAVVRASRWFAVENNNILSDPRVRLRLDDARRVLARDSRPLALLTSEPSNLWMSGVSLLFTSEFFAQAAERLGERGVLCQWLHLYQVGPADVRVLLRTVSTHFPHLIAFADGSDLLLVGSRSPLCLDPLEWQRRVADNPACGAMLARAGIMSAVDLANGIIADQRGIKLWAGAGPLHTDDRPILEFSAARAIASDYSDVILAELVRAGESAGEIALGKAGVVGTR